MNAAPDVFTARGIILRDASFSELRSIRPGLMPLFDPARTTLTADTSFALVGIKDGAPVLTGAGVLRNCPHGILHAIESRELFSDATDPDERAGITGDRSFLRDIGCRVVVIGAIWRAPEAGGGLLRPFWSTLVDQSLRQLQADWIVGLIRNTDEFANRIQKVGYEIEGFRHFWEGTAYFHPDWNGGHQESGFSLCAMSRQEALERVLKIGAAA